VKLSGLEHAHPERTRKFSTIAPGMVARPLIDDFPKIYIREKVGAMADPYNPQLQVGHVFSQREAIQDWALSYLEHDERALERRAAAQILHETKQAMTPFDGSPEVVLEHEISYVAHTNIWDPTKFCWPDILTEPIVNLRTAPYCKYPVVHQTGYEGKVWTPSFLVHDMVLINNFGYKVIMVRFLNLKDPQGFWNPLAPRELCIGFGLILPYL
jgi:hypothetical protein